MRSARLFMFALCVVLASAYLLLSEVRYAEIPDSPLFQASLTATKAELVSPPEPQFQIRSEKGRQRPTCEITCDASCHVATCGTTCNRTCHNTCSRTCSQPSCMVSCGPFTCDITCRNTCQFTCTNTCTQLTCEQTCLATCSYTCTMQLHAGAFNPAPEEEEE
jgi:hypothetical protein